MAFLKRFKFPVFAGFFLIVTQFSCSEELTTIGATVIGGAPFTTDQATYDVFAFNKKIEAVRANKLPLYQLGNFNDPIYGKTEASITSQLQLAGSNPSFGIYSQNIEDNPDPDIESQIPENEVVDSVILYIPFMTRPSLQRDSDGDGVDDEFDVDPADPNSDSDGDEVSDNQERINGTDPLDNQSSDPTADNFIQNNFAKTVDVDSIYGNLTQSFNLKVERSTFFLRDLDPNTNFQEAQQLYSSQQFSPSFVSDVLFDGPINISDKEILLTPPDDESTEDVDESLTFQKLNPGIRVQLNKDFFQTNFIDKEGSSELLSQANFAEYLRGIHLSIAQEDDIMLLLDMRNTNIKVHYSYDRFNTADDQIIKATSEYDISLITGAQTGLISGNAVNTLNSDPFPQPILDQMTSGLNKDEDEVSRIYLKGGAGSYAELELFERENGQNILNEIKANNWIINEANLVLHVDRDALDAAGGTIEPLRIYLYNADTGGIIFDPSRELNEIESLTGIFLNFNGILEQESGKGIKYKLRITDHINNMIVRDSTNATLAMVITPDINLIGVNNAMLNNTALPEDDISIANTLTPLGTVLFGTNVEAQNIDKKLQLEIFYTETN